MTAGRLPSSTPPVAPLRVDRSLVGGLLVATLAAAHGCMQGPAGLTWQIELPDEASIRRAAVVEARILRGGCDGTEVYAITLRPRASMGPVPPELEPGVWGFAADAQDASCLRFARSCEEITLPGTTLVVNQLEAVTESQVCTGARCNDGSCRTADEDGDGFGVCVEGEALGSCDCDDADATVHPSAIDPCSDGLDQDCDGADDLCDRDCDGYPEGRDCDDARPDVHPNGAVRELWGLADGDRLAHDCEATPMPDPTTDGCTPDAMGMPRGDGVDQDCNGLFDDGEGCTDPNDRDRDGARPCASGETVGCDANDCDPGVAPGRIDACGNGVDEDGDGMDAACPDGDGDRDGQAATSAGGTDCDDTDPHVFLGAPDDCRTPEAESCGTPVGCAEQGGDADGDGYVALPTSGRGDCNDHDPEVRPFAPEDPCDGVDNDCDDIVDEVGHAHDTSAGVSDGCIRAAGAPTPIDFDVTAPSYEHCGGCGIATAANEDCCGGVPTAIDGVDSCGGCGRACGPHTSCPASGSDAGGEIHACACAPDGMGRWDDCDGSLGGGSGGGNGCETDLDTDPLHCGACGRACGAHQSCVAGTCTCDGAFLDCNAMPDDGCEVDGSRDAANCMRCGNVCMLDHATAGCRAGVCALGSCSSGYGNCDGMLDNGCETMLTTLANCGTCGETCASVQHATAICTGMVGAGRCDYSSCAATFLDCDANRLNGCETPWGVTRCGSCSNVCGAGETCNTLGRCACGATSATMGPACGTGAACSGGICVAL